tara:strand:+ start:1011 stop:2483 length:1473 start_codon:yes stop_codon:yes gene_type:complete
MAKKKEQYTSSFENKIIHGIKKCSNDYGKINLKLILGVSGGPDSLSLLYSMHRISKLYPKYFTLYGAHMNHSLRGLESDQDAEFVISTFKDLRIPYYIKNLDSKKIHDLQKGSLEEIMRQNRYSFFGEISKDINADMVVTAHTYDDQIETILMNFIRGSGLNGLTGMQQISEKTFQNNSFILARPMLKISSEETNTYCKHLKLSPRFDQTNHLTRFTRNKIRHEIIPSLSKINPGIKKNIMNLSEIINDEYEYIKEITNENFISLSKINSNVIEICRPDFEKLHLNIRRNIIRKTIENLNPQFKNLQKINIEEILNSKTGTKLQPIENIVVYIDKNALIFKNTPHKSQVEKNKLLNYKEISKQGITKIKDWTIEVSQHRINPSNIPKYELNKSTDLSFVEENFDLDKIQFPIYVRSRQPGDRFQPLGMKSTKKLQDFFVDNGIPKRLRDSIPIVVSGEKLLWIVGHRTSNWSKITKDTTDFLKITFLKNN